MLSVIKVCPTQLSSHKKHGDFTFKYTIICLEYQGSITIADYSNRG